MSHYFDDTPEVASNPKLVSYTFAGHDYVFETDRGVFAYERIDKATRILLNEFYETYDQRPDSIVDVGCGYGVISVIAATLFPDAHVVGVEPNERARSLSAANAQRNSSSNVEVVPPDEYEGDTVDLILSNPPIRIGKEALYELLHLWVSRVHSQGEMWLVMAKNLGADSAADFLRETCQCEVTRIASKQGFRVLRVRVL